VVLISGNLVQSCVCNFAYIFRRNELQTNMNRTVPSPNQVACQFGRSGGKWVDPPNLICVTISKINVESIYDKLSAM
jgi:hypothetical protein